MSQPVEVRSPPPAVAAASERAPCPCVCPADGGVAAPGSGPQSIWEYKVSVSYSKFKVEGSRFAIGDPVHETMTVLALRDSSLDAVAGRDAASSIDYLRGVFWNDDPCAQLFDTANDLRPSYGLQWYNDFLSAERRSKKGRTFTELSCPRLGRSHFGDLQFLHGMAPRDEVEASETLEQLLRWSEFAYKVAMGAIDADAKLGVTPVAALFPGDEQLGLRQFFVAERREQVGPRALGSLLHLIQDSYAAGHTQREEAGGRRGKIVRFYSYANQDHDKHGKDDAWSARGSDRERVNAVRGGPDALLASTELLKLYRAKADWARVAAFLRGGPLALANVTGRSGPGEEYEKPAR